MNLLKKIEIEWRILFLAAIVLLAFAFLMQTNYFDKFQSTLQQSYDPGLEKVLRTHLPQEADSSTTAITDAIQRSRQWKALIPIIVEEQFRAIISYSLILFVSLLGLAFWSLRKITEPIRRLVKAAEQIGKGENAVIKKGSSGALGRLEESMDSMQQELIRLRERARAQGMETAWRDIARVMAHEIKNPLTPIQLTLDRIQEKVDDGSEVKPEELSRFVNRIGTQVTNLERLVNDFRSFAREPEPNCKIVKVSEVCAPLCKNVGSVNMNITGDADILADEHLLYRAFLNLWKNSLEAGADEINLRIETTLQNVLIYFEDNGSGIKPENSESIWIPYFTSKKGGTGLGLPVVKRMLESMNGTICVHYDLNAQKKGTTFLITFKKSDMAIDKPKNCLENVVKNG
ncbi:MAG: ATP-binding protein [Fibrobacter sp.]|nr:ATP-binding protein [Fibrobacter sp.]